MSHSDFPFFQFESDFVQSLRCIPMRVRYCLDSCGVKLKLEHWHQFTAAERQALVDLPCDTPEEQAAYRHYLQTLVMAHTQAPARDIPVDPHPPWLQPDSVPDAVQQQAQQFGTTIAIATWATLTPLQRFALCKLSRPGHENRNFLPALYEFKLTTPPQ